MPVIKPISDLRNKANETSHLAETIDEPIFITRNGEADMVVMSMAHYGKLQLKLELFSKLAVAKAERASGHRGQPLAQVMKNLRKRTREDRRKHSGGLSGSAKPSYTVISQRLLDRFE